MFVSVEQLLRRLAVAAQAVLRRYTTLNQRRNQKFISDGGGVSSRPFPSFFSLPFPSPSLPRLDVAPQIQLRNLEERCTLALTTGTATGHVPLALNTP